LKLYALPTGLHIFRFGLDHALVNPSVVPGKAGEKPTSGTCGLNFGGSLTSADLQLSLESRLRQRLEGYGSPEYALTWKQWDMQSGPPICALRASQRRTSGKGCTGERSGWNTPIVNDAEKRGKPVVGAGLAGAGNLTGWPSPNTPSGGRSVSIEKMDATGRTLDGKKHTASLEHAAKFVGWNSSRATDGSNGGPNQAGGSLSADANLAGWTTPQAMEPETDFYRPSRTATGRTTDYLGRQVQGLAGWATCASRDWRSDQGQKTDSEQYGTKGRPLSRQILGLTPDQSSAGTEKQEGYRLNPFFSLWLMGYPVEWGYSGVRAMQSCRNSRRNSSRRS